MFWKNRDQKIGKKIYKTGKFLTIFKKGVQLSQQLLRYTNCCSATILKQNMSRIGSHYIKL